MIDPKQLGQWFFKRVGNHYAKAWHRCYLETKRYPTTKHENIFVCLHCGAETTTRASATHTSPN